MKKLQLLVVLFLCLLLFMSCANFGLEDAKKLFQNRENDFTVVANYLSLYDYENILIRDANGTMNLLLDRVVLIDDDEVNEAISNLFFAGCYVISKNAEDNCVSFTIWNRFRDFSAGIHYSLDGVNAPTEQYLTKQESLGVDGWYYYEEDFNEWRISHDP